MERTRDLDHEIDAAWATVRQARESGRLNPRLSAAARVRRSEAFGDVLARLEQAVAETRSMARTIHGRLPAARDREFRARGSTLLGRAGAAVSDADSAALGEVRADLEAARRWRATAPGRAARCWSTCATSSMRWARSPTRSRCAPTSATTGAQLTIGLPSG